MTTQSGKCDFFERDVYADSEVEDPDDDEAPGGVDPVVFSTCRPRSPAPSGTPPPPGGPPTFCTPWTPAPGGTRRCWTSTPATSPTSPRSRPPTARSPVLTSEPDHFDVVVRDIFGATWTFEVTAHCTVAALRERIRGKDGIPPDQQRLVFDGKQLEDGRTLHSYGVGDGDTLDLLLRGAQYASSRFPCETLRQKDR